MIQVPDSDARKFLKDEVEAGEYLGVEDEEGSEEGSSDETEPPEDTERSEALVEPSTGRAKIGSSGNFARKIGRAVREVVEEYSDDVELYGHDPEEFGDFSVLLESGNLSSVRVLVDVHKVAGNIFDNQEVVDTLVDNGVESPDNFFETRDGHLRFIWDFS